MTFTYIEDDIIIVTTRKDTKKYQLMKLNSNVSLLFHKFSQLSKSKDT